METTNTYVISEANNRDELTIMSEKFDEAVMVNILKTRWMGRGG